MEYRRVIPILLLQNKGLVKTIKFRNPGYVGDIINAVKIFNEKEVDELIVLDIDASKTGSPPSYDIIRDLANECFMPLCYGGGIATLEQADRVFSLGVEKISLQTAAIKEKGLITAIANKFGSQSVVVSLDVKKNLFGRYVPYLASENRSMEKNMYALLKEFVLAGAGEILLNSVNRDGTLKGPDTDLISAVTSSVDIPVIAAGGVGSLSDIKKMFDSGASAVGAGAYFVFYGPHRAVLITYPGYSKINSLFH